MSNSDDFQHSFAVCAYGESPYLTECVESLLAQEGPKSRIYLATSTPNDWIQSVARRYDLRLYVNEGESGIGQDWNFAYSMAETPFVTIAHQDDVYAPSYAREATKALDVDPRSIIFFSNYGELRKNEHVDDNRLLRVKRLLLTPITNRKKAGQRWRKRAILRFGSAICCPSVTFNSKNCPNPPFVTGMSSNLDWETWERLSRLDGTFLYDERILMYHRIHAESATSKLIANQKRNEEDLEMLQRFWPSPIARLIEVAYSRGTDSNELA